MRISGVYVDDNGEGDSGFTEPEVDAVADVAPVSAYEKWVESNYTDWTTAWKSEVTGAEAVAANGKKNGVNFALGLSATATANGLDFKIVEFEPGETTHRLVLKTAKQMTDAGGLVVRGGDAPGRLTNREVPVLESSTLVDGAYRNVLKVSASCGKFFRLALDVQ